MYSSNLLDEVEVLLLGALPKECQGGIGITAHTTIQGLQLNLVSRICGNTADSANAFLYALNFARI